ncbi:uncharacterized protein F5147DRAFT_761900 [Suillus discolor]|uniref:Uncharacterized protein n=1 Tax=Suillus discolor TaxID=1912936 RepID=A0A9P7JSV2_9AGAM|nr:uncharacterized protein F5147DRAFT_761900 [Suillus discolor]KAG2105454.1 hypothetical protein F5147DRAFT_761900 [Suillus discolor]
MTSAARNNFPLLLLGSLSSKGTAWSIILRLPNPGKFSGSSFTLKFSISLTLTQLGTTGRGLRDMTFLLMPRANSISYGQLAACCSSLVTIIEIERRRDPGPHRELSVTYLPIWKTRGFDLQGLIDPRLNKTLKFAFTNTDCEYFIEAVETVMLHISIRQTADSIANDLNDGHSTWQIEVFLPDPNAPEVAKPEAKLAQ